MFAAEGAAVAIADLNVDMALRSAAEIKDDGNRAMAVPLDVTDEMQWIAAFKQVTARFGVQEVARRFSGLGDQFFEGAVSFGLE